MKEDIASLLFILLIKLSGIVILNSWLSLNTVNVELSSKNKLGSNNSASLSHSLSLIKSILSPVLNPASKPNSNAKIPFLLISSFDKYVSPLLNVIMVKIIKPVITLNIMPPSITTNLCQAGFDLNSHDSGSLFIWEVSIDSSIIPDIFTKPPRGIEPSPYSVPL